MKKNIISFILGAVIFSTITAYATNGNLIEVFYNVKQIVVNGSTYSPQQKPFIYNGSVYVPLRFIGQSFGKKVSWDSNIKTVFIEDDIKKDDQDIIEEYDLKISDAKEKLNLLCQQISSDLNLESIKKALIDFRKNTGDESIQQIYFAKETGELYIEPEKEFPDDFDARVRPWYRHTKEEGEYTSDMYIDTYNREIATTITKGIYENGKFIGVVGLDLILEHGK